jgi:hypothetical protein
MPMGTPGRLGPDTLFDRVALADLVTAYAMALDARDWAAYRNLFEEEVEIDYRSLGSIHATMTAEAWTARCKVLGGFDATLHKVSNFVVALDGDRASVTSYVSAAHFLDHQGRALAANVAGTYLHDCRRGPDGWKIRKCTLTVAGYPGGKAAFDEAFAIARAKAGANA